MLSFYLFISLPFFYVLALCGWGLWIYRVHPLFHSLAIPNFKNYSLLVLSFVNSTQLPDLIAVFAQQREQVPFSMAMGNVELMHEYFPKHLYMGTGRMKLDIEIEKEGDKRRVNMKRTPAGRKKMFQWPGY